MKRPAIDLQRHVFPALLTLTLAGSLGASCGKKPSANTDEAKHVVLAIDHAEGPETGPKKPIAGVDLKELGDDQKARFDKLVDSLVSPCGKATSLRKAANTDPECKRALFAARYVAYLIGEAASDSEIRELYGDRYVDKKVHTFQLKNIPHAGPEDAPVVLVEFFDYECPACKAAVSLLDQLLDEFDGKLVIYFKQFPIEGHAHSVAASYAAIAAYKQGKYVQMHEALMADQTRHTKDELFETARGLGLDMTKFAADYAAADPVVLADKKEGVVAGVDHTPTFFINGRMYNDPITPELLKMWIEEEVGIAR